jgi:hypothetical protein
MTVIFPEGVAAQGNVKIQYVPAYVSSAAPKLTEINAAGSLDLSCLLYEGSGLGAAETSKGTAPRRLCSKQTFERFGSSTFSVGDLMYVWDPQGATGTNGNLAYTKLVEGTVGFLTYRFGLDARTSVWAIGQYVITYPVTFGPQNETADTSDEFAEIHITQSVIVTGPRIPRVALVA